jgi:hypothetical protein
VVYHRIGRVAEHLARDAAVAVAVVLEQNPSQLPEGSMSEDVGQGIAQTLFAKRDLGR